MTLVEVDERARAAAAQWRLELGRPLSGGARSAVFAAQDASGRDLVLKLSGPAATAAEAAALTAWAGSGAAVTLVDATAEALLLVRVRPGTCLPWRARNPIEDTAAVAADLLSRLWSTSPGTHRYPALSETYGPAERVARADAAAEQRRRGDPDRGRTGLSLLPTAAAAVARLIATTAVPVLLHGDLVSKNVLRDGAGTADWVAIDPLPQRGDPAADVGAFAAYHPADQILPLAENLARQSGVDVRRALGWTAVWAVHQATQAWRDDQSSLDELVRSPALTALLRVWP